MFPYFLGLNVQSAGGGQGFNSPLLCDGVVYFSYQKGSFKKSAIKFQRLGFMKAKDLDKEFDSGEKITEFLDFTKARRSGQEQKRVNVDFPVWMIHSLDKEAKRLGVARQSIIKIWIAERLKEVSK